MASKSSGALGDIGSSGGNRRRRGVERILAGDCAGALEKRLGFISGKHRVDGGGINDEASDVKLPMENVNQPSDGEDDE